MRVRATFRAKAASSKKLTRWASSISILSVTAALVVSNLTPVVVTSASWTDEEWDHGEIGTIACADDGSGSTFKTRGSGRLLSGGLLPADLDSVATAGGVTVTNDGTRPRANPETANAVDGAYVNALDVGVLNLIELPLTGGGLDDLLSLPLATEVGAVNQYARADADGQSQGAGGVVNDSGFIQTDNNDNGGLPTLGTLELSTLVEQLTGQAISGIVSGITDLELEIGAVASRATLDACETAWTGDIDSNLDRTYAIAGLDAKTTVPAVGGLSEALEDALKDLELAVEGLAGDGGVLAAVTSGLGGLIGGLGLGDVSLDGTTVEIDLTAVRALLTASVHDESEVLELNVGTGEVEVDLAALLGEAYGGSGFNGEGGLGLNDLAPNTELLVNSDVTNALTAALNQALGSWVDQVLTALTGAVMSATVAVVVSVEVQPVGLSLVTITLTGNASLQALIDGNVGLKADLTLLGLPCGILCSGLSGVVNALTGGVGKIVGLALESALLGTPESKGLVPALIEGLMEDTASVVDLLSVVFNDVLGAEGLLSIRVNVQNAPAAGTNDPDPDPPLTYPEWDDPDSSRAVPDGQFDVAALSVSVLDLVGTEGNINLELARSSVGVSCAVGGQLDHDGLCPDY